MAKQGTDSRSTGTALRAPDDGRPARRWSRSICTALRLCTSHMPKPSTATTRLAPAWTSPVAVSFLGLINVGRVLHGTSRCRRGELSPLRLLGVLYYPPGSRPGGRVGPSRPEIDPGQHSLYGQSLNASGILRFPDSPGSGAVKGEIAGYIQGIPTARRGQPGSWTSITTSSRLGPGPVPSRRRPIPEQRPSSRPEEELIPGAPNSRSPTVPGGCGAKGAEERTHRPAGSAALPLVRRPHTPDADLVSPRPSPPGAASTASPSPHPSSR